MSWTWAMDTACLGIVGAVSRMCSISYCKYKLDSVALAQMEWLGVSIMWHYCYVVLLDLWCWYWSPNAHKPCESLMVLFCAQISLWSGLHFRPTPWPDIESECHIRVTGWFELDQGLSWLMVSGHIACSIIMCEQGTSNPLKFLGVRQGRVGGSLAAYLMPGGGAGLLPDEHLSSSVSAGAFYGSVRGVWVQVSCAYCCHSLSGEQAVMSFKQIIC